MEGGSKPQPETQEERDPRPYQNPDGLRQNQGQKSCQENPDEDDVTDNVLEDGDPAPDQPEVQTEDGFPTLTPIDSAEFSPGEKIQDSRDEASCPDRSQTHLDLTCAAANLDEALGSGGCVPELLATEADQHHRSAAAHKRAARPADLVIPAAVSMSSLTSGCEAGDVTYCDLQSPRSDSFSVTSEMAISRKSEEDDTRSVTASSVMSLFHRVQLEPLEKDWLRSSAVGNVAAQRLLLAQEPGLVLKKDFITGFTALHWAAKQGRKETVDMMLRSGADVNVRSHGGYTALHLASIHGHQDVVQTLISTYNAKTNIRDYHGKTAVQYWSGCKDIFNKADPHAGGRFFSSRRTQRFALPSLRLSRSRSQGQLHLEFGAAHQSASYEALDLHV